ncbi:MAG: hypothetical protein ACRD0P_25885 [Stackebrandtia sp.]
MTSTGKTPEHTSNTHYSETAAPEFATHLRDTGRAVGHHTAVLAADVKTVGHNGAVAAKRKLTGKDDAKDSTGHRVSPAQWLTAAAAVTTAGAGVAAALVHRRREARKPWWRKLSW